MQKISKGHNKSKKQKDKKQLHLVEIKMKRNERGNEKKWNENEKK